MVELTIPQQRLLAQVREMAADPLRRMTAHQVLLVLRAADHDRDGDHGPTLAERHQLTERQVDDLLNLLETEPVPVAPVSPAPAGPRRESPMPAQVASWDTTCTGEAFRFGLSSCIDAMAQGWINPPDFCPGCTKLHMDLVEAAIPDVAWHPNYYRRAGVEAAVEGGEQR